MTSDKRTQVGYISAIPSLGKTHWARKQMVTNLLNGQSSLYVAPTIRLLDEVYARLRKSLTPKQFKRVFNINHETCSGGVANVIRKRLSKPDPQGRIVLITHDSFLDLQYHSAFAELDVFFDEARKVVVRGAQVKLTATVSQALFSRLFQFEPRAEGASFRKVTCRPNAEKILRKHPGFSGDATLVEQFAHIRQLLRKAADPRMEVFLRFPKEGDELVNSGDVFLMKDHNFYEVILPSRIFEGFRKVTVLAAHFEDSQMYHLLKESNHTQLIPIEWGQTVEGSRYANLVARYQSVTVVPLTMQYQALSMHKLTQSVMAPLREREKILSSLKTKSVSWIRTALRKQKQSTAYTLEKNQLKDMKYLKSLGYIEFDPLAWHIRAFKQVLDAWSMTSTVQGLPLVMMNNRFTDKKSSSYLKLLRDEQQKPWAELLPFMNHGLNEFDTQNVLGFLAAINPDSAMVEFYRERLPDYSFEHDHVADICVQSACRLSVRDPDSEDEVLVVVPDFRIAELLNSKLFHRGLVDTRFSKRLGDMTTLNNKIDNYLAPDEADRARKKLLSGRRAVNNARMTTLRNNSAYHKRLQSIANMISQAKKKGKAGEERRKQLEAERDALKLMRQKNPSMDDDTLVEKVKAKFRSKK